MNEEARYRLLAAAFRDDERGALWRERLGDDLRPALDLIVDGLGRLVATPPQELDRQQVASLLADYLPGLMGAAESFRNDLPDLLEDFLVFTAREVGVASEWEWISAIADGRDAYESALSEATGPRYRVRAEEPHRRAGSKLGRNDPCPCGSGKKYKHCCLKLA